MILPTDQQIITLAVLLAPFIILTLLVAFWQLHRHERDLEKQKKEINQRIYETLILRDIGERIGYELNIGKILETIINSLNKLLSFTAVSYMLIVPDGSSLDFEIHLEESVNQTFLDTMRDHMLTSVNSVSPRKFVVTDLRVSITGTILDETKKEPVASLWLIPLTINNRGLGALAIASKFPGLYQGPEMDILVKIVAQANRAVNNLEKIVDSEKGKLNAMVASMADGVLMLGKQLELLVVNPAVAAMLGLAVEKQLTIFDIAQSLADKIDLRSKIEESTKTQKVVTVDNLAVGDKISQLLISPVQDQNQGWVGTVVLFHDVTAQRQLERIREEFTAMMVHELRAPLTVVRGATDMFIRDPAMTSQPQGQELLKTLENSATTMLALVNDLLDVAKIEAGKFQILKTKNNLTEIISSQVTLFSQLASQKSITITTDFADNNLLAEFDRDRIAQVLNNLLSNAIKFSPVGAKITATAYKVNMTSDIKWRFTEESPPVEKIDSPSILVAVSDTGRGIPAEKIPELFSKFRQLHSASEEKGTGLGLVIVKGIVESHGGQTFLESRVNEGTTFYFTLPLSAPIDN